MGNAALSSNNINFKDKTRNIYLMTVYQPQPCISADSFATIQRVENKKDYRLTRTYGNVNFTDLWLSITDSVENLEGKYIGQHFSLLCDEVPAIIKNFWNNCAGQEHYALISFIKIRHDIPGITLEKVKNKLSAYTKNRKGYIFRTIENADLLLLFPVPAESDCDAICAEITGLNCENLGMEEHQNDTVYYSFYFITAQFEKPSAQQNYYRLKNIKPLDKSPLFLLKANSAKASWCLSITNEIRQKMKDCLNRKDKKWLSYYMALYQLVNLLGQYEQETKSKDLFFVFFPAVSLFYAQLSKGQEHSQNLLNQWQKESNIHDAEKIKKEYFESIEKVERATSEFIDSMETILHHIGISCANILNFNKNNGLAYDIPLKLYMLYLSSLHLMAKILNNSNHTYRFLVTPLAYSRPVTHIFDFDLEPTDRLISVEIARHQMYSPRAMLAILSHEAGHYIGLQDPCRKKRAECLIDMLSIALTEILLPGYKMEDIIQEHELTGSEKQYLYEDWKRRKNNFQKYFNDKMKDELKKCNAGREYPFYLNELKVDLSNIIKTILYDEQRYLQNIMNEISPDLKKCMHIEKKGITFFEILEAESALLEDNIQKELCTFAMAKILNSLCKALKEAYADIGSIKLLQLRPENYLEAYLLTESYEPQSNAISSSLLNRVALVHDIFKSDHHWMVNWAKINAKTWGKDSFLWDLKQKVDSYHSEWNKSSSDLRHRKNVPGNSNVKEFDPFMERHIICYERDYLTTAFEKLKNTIDSKETENKKLINLYRHFEVYKKNKDTSFEELFRDYESILEIYKQDIKNSWSSVSAIPKN